jgi:glucose-6-phosphate dehydrogenase assembly protein OpcA
VWCAEDLSNVPLLASIVDMGRQLVYDSRHGPASAKAWQALEPWQHLDLADVNWRRLAPIRRAVIEAAKIDRSDWRPGDVSIAHRADHESLAWLLVGWLASRLGWNGVRPRIEPAAGRRRDHVAVNRSWRGSDSHSNRTAVRSSSSTPAVRRQSSESRTKARRTPWQRSCTRCPMTSACTTRSARCTATSARPERDARENA